MLLQKEKIPTFVVDAGLGNVGAIVSMLRRIGQPALLIDAPRRLPAGARLILPGVGAFDAGMQALEERDLHHWLIDVVTDGAPILGICLGMQMLFSSSEEGFRRGLGLIPGDVTRLPIEKSRLRLPHMGWNIVQPTSVNPIVPIGADEQQFYFVHSYFVNCSDPENSVAVTNYGIEFTSAVRRRNIFGVQFHPEKSHRFGKALLERFSAGTNLE